jgi:Gpi18-like mannosyltransferase
MLTAVGLAFALSRGAFLLIAAFAVLLLPELEDDEGTTVLHAPVFRLVDVFWRWDAIHYHALAYDGYHDDGGLNAFFPLFPLLVRLTSMLLNGALTVTPRPIEENTDYGFLLAGILVPNVCFPLACALFYRLVLRDGRAEPDGGHALAGRAVLYLALSPLALYFIVPYAESLFLCLTVGCFFFLRRRAWLWAGLCGFGAALTRQTGILLLLPFLVELALARRREGGLRRPREIGAALAGLALVPLGLGTFMLVLQWRIGNPLAFVQAQRLWEREYTLPWQTIADGLWYLLHPAASNSPSTYGTGVLNGGLTLGFLVIALLSARSWRGSYTVYVLASLLLILSNHLIPPLIFHSMGRYVLVLFPVFLTLARWGRRREVDTAILAFSLVLFSLGVALYVRWYPVA